MIKQYLNQYCTIKSTLSNNFYFHNYSDADSDSSDELVGGSFMEHHRRAISVQRERESIARDISARESIQREVRASIARESVARQLHTMPEEPELKM